MVVSVHPVQKGVNYVCGRLVKASFAIPLRNLVNLALGRLPCATNQKHAIKVMAVL